MRILLISANSLSFAGGARWSQKKQRHAYAPATLTTLAALVPPDLGAEVRIIDEAVDSVPDDFWNADIVGISAMTPDAKRAYGLCGRARRAGATVVIGGYHATFMPQEAALHADAVVAGFAEEAWPRLLNDFTKGSIGKLYRGPWRGCFEGAGAFPRRDLLRRKAYRIPATIEATRGCSHCCAFCTIPPMHENGFVCRSVSRVVEEIKAMGEKRVALLDSNPFDDPVYGAALLAGLESCNIEWFAAATFATAANRQFAKTAAASGCRGLLVGFESLNRASLAGDNKSHIDSGRYKDACRMLHDEGIAILGCFVFGFDGDDASVFERTVNLVDDCSIDIVLYSAYTPFPGTAAAARLAQQGRITDTDWDLYDGRHVVFAPLHMSADTLQEGIFGAWKQTYGISSIVKRVAGASTMPFFDLAANVGFHVYTHTFLPENS
jgi:radical SAM superfamily enzyme YgiQ (UPF0313 family)